MSEEHFLPYAFHNIDDSDREAVSKVFSSSCISRGPCVAQFEADLASYVGAPYAVAFCSGSAALDAAYLAISLSDADTLVSTPNTFIATVAQAKRVGTEIALVDIDAHGNIDIDAALEKLHDPRSRGRAIFAPVHFGGLPVDMVTLSEKIYQPNVVIIEDAAHALGSSYSDGRRVGCCAYSDMTIFSFHPAKNITSGEGGAVTCTSEALYHTLQRIRNSGIEREAVHHHAPSLGYYEVNHLSSNYHMSELHAALGISQLKRIEQFHQHKLALMRRYLDRFANFPGITPLFPEVSEKYHMHLFVVSLAFEAFGLKRPELMAKLNERGIGTQYHYVPLYYHDALNISPKHLDLSFPRMEAHFSSALSLPFFSSMKLSDVDRVVDTLRDILFGD